MKALLFSTVLFAVCLGSCKDKEPSFCSIEVDLGEFKSTTRLPYDTFRYEKVISINADTGGISINHSALVNGPEMFHHKKSTISYSSDCESLGAEKKYIWRVAEQRSVLLILLDHSAAMFLIKALPIFDPSKPEIGPVGEYFHFFITGPGGSFETDPFFTVMTKEIVAGEGAGFEGGYQKLDALEINGQTFTNLITNQEPLQGGSKHIYFSLEQGLIGFKDSQDVLWRIDI